MKKLLSLLTLCLCIPQLLAAPGCALTLYVYGSFLNAGGEVSVYPTRGSPYSITSTNGANLNYGDLVFVGLPTAMQCQAEAIWGVTVWTHCGTNDTPHTMNASDMHSCEYIAYVICDCPHAGIGALNVQDPVFCGPPPQ